MSRRQGGNNFRGGGNNFQGNQNQGNFQGNNQPGRLGNTNFGDGRGNNNRGNQNNSPGPNYQDNQGNNTSDGYDFNDASFDSQGNYRPNMGGMRNMGQRMVQRQQTMQQRIRGCVMMVVIGALALLALAIAKLFYSRRIGEEDSVQVFLEDGLDPVETGTENLFQDIGWLFFAMTFFAVIVASFVVCCSTNRYNNFMGQRLCLLFAFLVFTSIAGFYYSIGGFLLAAKDNNSEWIKDNCEAANNNKAYEGGFWAQTKTVFEVIEDLDKEYQAKVNRKMCTDFCICPGTTRDPHYLQYERYPEYNYNQYGRTFYGAANRQDLVQMRFTLGNRDLESYQSYSLKACFDNLSRIDLKRQQIVESVARSQGGSTYDLNAALQRMKAQATDMILSRPAKEFEKLVTYMEKQYDCSGLCRPALFYYNRPITDGIPKQGCMAPFIDDVAEYFYDLGAVFLTTALVLTLMICCMFPICFYRTDEQQMRDRERMKNRMQQMRNMGMMGNNMGNNQGNYDYGKSANISNVSQANINQTTQNDNY